MLLLLYYFIKCHFINKKKIVFSQTIGRHAPQDSTGAFGSSDNVFKIVTETIFDFEQNYESKSRYFSEC